MQEQPTYLQEPFEGEQLSRGGHLAQVLYGIGVSLGLALLWLMEIARNMFFHLLDRLNLKLRRRRRASAFPPGRPRKHPPVLPASSQG
jgi:hypothetical protein